MSLARPTKGSVFLLDIEMNFDSWIPAKDDFVCPVDQSDQITFGY